MTSQTKWVCELLDILERMAAAYGEVAELERQKRNGLAAGDLTAVRSIVAKEEQIVVAIEAMELRRMELQTAVLGQENSLDRWILALESPFRERAAAAGERLKTAVREFQTVRESNELTIRHLTNFNRQKLNLLLGTSTKPGYGKDGGSSAYGGRNGTLDRMV
jgi:hypothetical protein